jgi:putative ABC transport system permease protein
MKTKKLTRIISQNLRRNRKNLVFSSIGIVVGISSFVFFIALGTGIKHVVATEIFPVAANRVQVVPRTAQFGSLAAGRIIDDDTLTELRALPGVKAVYARMRMSFLATSTLDGRDISPTAMSLLSKIPGITPQMVGSVKNIRMYLEIMGTGVDPRLVADDIIAGEFKDPPEGQPIPVLLSRRMIEIYNTSFAMIRSLPQINEMVIPFIPPVPLSLNKSFISRGHRGKPIDTKMKVVGLSHQAIMGGITVPLETAKKYNRMFVGEQAARTYSAAIVEVNSSDFLGPVQETVKKLGYDIDLSERRMAESIGLIVTLVTLGFTLISLIIVGIAAVSIAHTFFMIIYERKREIGLLRAMGATRADIRRIILGEASFVGVVGGILGTGLGILICFLVDLVVAKFLPDFPFKPETFFTYPIWLFFGAISFAVCFCVLGAFFPAHRAASLDPASTLTGR